MRTTVFVLAGLLLLLANLWFVRSVQRSLLARDLVLAPFEVLEGGGSAQRQSEGLARILNVRLASILRDLATARRDVSRRNDGRKEKEKEKEKETEARAAQLAAATLFLPEEVAIPSGLLRPVDITVSVAGVEVGGLLSWVQRAVLRPKTLTFTVIEKGETALVSADLSGFIDSGDPYVSFECKNAPDDIATSAAYALIQRRLSTEPQRSLVEYLRDLTGGVRPLGGSQTRQLMLLDLADFRFLIDAILSVDRLNARVRRGYVLDREFDQVLASLEPLTGKLPDYYELQYFLGSVAESAGNKAKAAKWYRGVVSAPSAAVSSAIVADAGERLKLLEAHAPVARTDAEQSFIAEAERFAELMGLSGASPAIVFEKQKVEGIQAFWNAELHRYEVNPEFVTTPGIPQYVALMGRFMEQHYDRCFGGENPTADGDFWNQFRYSVVDYLIQSVPEFSKVQAIGSGFPWFGVLKSIEEQTGQPPRRLALELLNRYECNWNAGNIEARVTAVAQERGLVAPEVVQKAFQSVRPRKPRASR